MNKLSSILLSCLVAVHIVQLYTDAQFAANVPSDMPTEHQKYVEEEYAKFMAERKKQKQKDQKAKQQEQQQQIPKDKGFSPMEMGMKRDLTSDVELTEQVSIPGGVFWFGTQMDHLGKIMPTSAKDGADPRKKVIMKPFMLDKHTVTNKQFKDFIDMTHYKTEAELFRWSFVMANEVSDDTRKEVDGPNGMGRVKTSPHWMGVVGAAWHHPQGLDSSVAEKLNYPVVHISYNDAVEYCAWVGRRLPTEKEWEYGARGGLVNQSYPWGNKFLPGHMNIWESDDFPNSNSLDDGYLGPAPVDEYEPNDYGLYNMLGNVWEWVKGGKPEKRILRGGSFIDSVDGKYNHIVLVSTRQYNSGDSAASNTGFRCASTVKESSQGSEL